MPNTATFARKTTSSARTCKHCGAPFHGRPDKKYCSVPCKNRFNHLRRARTRDEVKPTDAFLHRNREILEELMDGRSKQTFSRYQLDRMGFRYSIMTGLYFNKAGKMYRQVYDYAWMDFSDQKILVVRRRIFRNG